jgi:hypothetical protein
MSFAVIGSIMLGIAVICGLMKSGEVNGCFGFFLVLLLVGILVGAGLVVLLFTVGGEMF